MVLYCVVTMVDHGTFSSQSEKMPELSNGMHTFSYCFSMVFMVLRVWCIHQQESGFVRHLFEHLQWRIQ